MLWDFSLHRFISFVNRENENCHLASKYAKIEALVNMLNSIEELNLRFSEIAASAERRIPSPRVAIIGDREFGNLGAIIGYINEFPWAMQLGGVIVPGGEFDDEIIIMADAVRDMREKGMGIPILGEEEDDTIGMRFLSPEAEFSFHHAPYDPARLRNEPSYRRSYCENLLDLLQRMSPDIIFLSNFKVFLDPVVVEAYPGRIINVHPSKLPLLKGFRPESRADSGENPQAAGFTFHVADTDLDGGPTLFQQKVSIDPYDPEQEARLGKNTYARLREEQLRLKIIQAQAKYSPDVLALYASPAERKIVEDGEAFIFEKRAGFENSSEYQACLQEDYERWKKEHEADVSYIQWYQQYRKPYRRILFNVGRGWETAEMILGAEEFAEVETPAHVITRYDVEIPLGDDTNSAALKFFELLTRAEEISAASGGRVIRQRFIKDAAGVVRGSIMVPADLLPVLTEMGISFTTELYPTRVGAARKPIQWVREEEDQG